MSRRVRACIHSATADIRNVVHILPEGVEWWTLLRVHQDRDKAHSMIFHGKTFCDAFKRFGWRPHDKEQYANGFNAGSSFDPIQV